MRTLIGAFVSLAGAVALGMLVVVPAGASPDTSGCVYAHGVFLCPNATDASASLEVHVPGSSISFPGATDHNFGSGGAHEGMPIPAETVIDYTDPKSFDAGAQQGFDVTTRTRQPGEPEAEDEMPVITYADVEYAARSAMTSLQLPFLAPQIGPNPANNEWNMLAVGYPIWLWTTPPGTLGNTVTQNGITLNLHATAQSTTYSMGDGTTFTCWASTPYTAGSTPGSPSPTCGHTYFKKGHYTIQATTGWTINWSALGYSGTLSTTTTATTPLEIGELKAVVVG